MKTLSILEFRSLSWLADKFTLESNGQSSRVKAFFSDGVIYSTRWISNQNARLLFFSLS